jgi:hypothetical protein
MPQKDNLPREHTGVPVIFSVCCVYPDIAQAKGKALSYQNKVMCFSEETR